MNKRERRFNGDIHHRAMSHVCSTAAQTNVQEVIMDRAYADYKISGKMRALTKLIDEIIQYRLDTHPDSINNDNIYDAIAYRIVRAK